MSARTPIPNEANACLLLADGTAFFGESIGTGSPAIGEICFNTAMTGYQEVLTDPSYAGQIITFTFPHIGNTGCNDEDIEAAMPRCAGLVLRERPTLPSNFRSRIALDDWLKKNGLSGICGIDTRALTRYIRKHGAQNARIVSHESWVMGHEKCLDELRRFPSMKGQELAAKVTTNKTYEWTNKLWKLRPMTHDPRPMTYHVVAIDYGIKQNILRSLAEVGCKVTIVPATMRAEEIMQQKPDGIFLSNGPGDPAATAEYAIPIIQSLITNHQLPIFGICLGHQLLGLALGGKTEKMAQGHRGANHPIKDLKTGKVIITSQNHGFAVSKEGLPKDVEVTHISLFDGTVQGLKHKTKPIFCLQGHPEASPGPHDSQYVFREFVKMMEKTA